MGDSTMDVIQFFLQAGVDMAPSFKDAPDHIVTELEFMYFLIHREILALNVGDERSFLEKLQMQGDFLSIHLSRWVEEFTREIKNGTQTDYWVNLADVTHIFVAEEAKALADLELPQR